MSDGVHQRWRMSPLNCVGGVIALVFVGAFGQILIIAHMRMTEVDCAGNLSMIGIGLENYRHEHGAYPPLATEPSGNAPSCSWRVLILPYLERQDLYDQYDFSEAWDGPRNRQLLTKIPSVYRCPNDTSDEIFTSYLRVEPADIQREKEDRTELNDHYSELILVYEAVGTEIEWTQPKDISLNALKTAPANQVEVKANHRNDYTYVSDGIDKHLVHTTDSVSEIVAMLESQRAFIAYKKDKLRDSVPDMGAE